MRSNNTVFQLCKSLLPVSLRASRRSGRDRRDVGCIAVERLESRQLLTTMFQVNAHSPSQQFTDLSRSMDSVATDAAGNFVVTWRSGGSVISTNQVKARRFNSNSVPLGDEFIVNAAAGESKESPVVAMNASGQFVVAWTSSTAIGKDVFAQRFDSNGQQQGQAFRLNTFTMLDQGHPTIAMKDDGSFVAAWTSVGQDGSGDGVYVRRFTSGGVGLGAETRVNVVTANSQSLPTIGIAANGTFVVSWQSSNQDGSGSGIYARRFSALAVPLSAEIRINNTTAGPQTNPSLAVSADGSFIVSWESDGQDGSGPGVYARRYFANGASQGNEFLVNTTTTGNQRRSHVGVESNGQFVILWESVLQNRTAIMAQRFQSTGAKLGTELVISHSQNILPYAPGLALNASGHLAMVWSHRWTVTGVTSEYNVWARKYRTTPVVLDVLDKQRSLPNGSQNNAQIARLIVVFDRNMESMSGISGRHSVLNPQNWILRREGEVVSNRIESIRFGRNAATNRYEAELSFSRPLDAGAWQITVSSAISDLNGTRLDGNRDLIPGDSYSHTFEIVDYSPATNEARIDTVRNGVQTMQPGKSLAIAPDGRSVVVYRNFAAGNTDSEIFARRYDEYGSPVGNPFQVNTTTAGYQLNPAVSINASGAFVVVWRHFSGGIRAQRFTATGQRSGTELAISAAGDHPDVVLRDNGEFSIVWDAPDAHQTGIYIRLYTNSGAPKSAARLVNTTTTDIQQRPVVEMDAGGNHLVVWESRGQDGDGYGIIARRLNTTSTAIGAEFIVNTTAAGQQTAPTASIAGDGQFVIAWHSQSAALSQTVHARRYDSGGAAVGNEILVHAGSTPSVAMEPDGDFVVAWSHNIGTGLFYRRYSQGVALGNRVTVIPGTSGYGNNSTVAVSPSGTMGIVWQGNTESSATERSWSRFYRPAGAVTRQPGNVLQIVGTRTSDTILVQQSGAGATALLTVNRSGVVSSFPASSVTSLRIDALGGHDNVIAESSVNRPITFYGGTGNDNLTGGGSSDVFFGGPGHDVMIGRTGNDRYVFETAGFPENDTVTELSGEGTDTLDFSTIGSDIILTLGSNASQAVHTNRTLSSSNFLEGFENVNGGSANDLILGNNLANHFWGNSGDDFLFGFTGNDVLNGGNGNDILFGGVDVDILLGGLGDDILIGGLNAFSPTPDSLAAIRVVWSSSATYEDRIEQMRAGVGNPLISFIAGAAMNNDDAQDTMTGHAGQDWFFRSLDDVITDLFASETADAL